MIHYLEGTLKEKSPSYIILEVNRTGYRINIPFSIFEHLPSEGKKVKIYTYLHIKENGIALYGFLKPEERDFFLNLISLSKIGPRSALRMFSRASPLEFKKAVMEKNLTWLVQTPGIGKKTAQRLILELGEIAGERLPSLEEEGNIQDGIAALCSLGYTRSQAKEAIKKALEKNSRIKENLTSLVKEALKYV